MSNSKHYWRELEEEDKMISEMLFTHDCHASPHDGCECEDWWLRLVEVRRELKTYGRNDKIFS